MYEDNCYIFLLDFRSFCCILRMLFKENSFLVLLVGFEVFLLFFVLIFDCWENFGFEVGIVVCFFIWLIFFWGLILFKIFFLIKKKLEKKKKYIFIY